MHVVQHRWRAMGSDAHVVIVDAGTGTTTSGRHWLRRLVDGAVDRVAELEGLWSRFLPTSEISRLNRHGSAGVSPETFALIDRAIVASQATAGRFDPTQLRALEELGYDRPFDQLDRNRSPNIRDGGRGAGVPVDSLPMGCAGIVLDPLSRTVILPDPVTCEAIGRTAVFDPGGIGKGFAADLVVEELLAAGATGALVNLGGDLRVEGTPPAGDNWVIEVGEDAWSTEPLAVLELRRGAVATSTPLRRRWSGAHHLLDPATRLPVAGGPALVTAIAGEGWWAEAAATALAVEGDAGSQAGWDAAGNGVAAAVVGFDGAVELAGGFERFTRSSPADAGALAGIRWSR